MQDVTPENFLDILQGKNMNGTGSGKTIKRLELQIMLIQWGVFAFPLPLTSLLVSSV